MTRISTQSRVKKVRRRHPPQTSQSLDVDSGETSENIQFSKRETFSAFLGLLAFDLLMKFAGFKSLIKGSRDGPRPSRGTTDGEVSSRAWHGRSCADVLPKESYAFATLSRSHVLLVAAVGCQQMVLAAQEFPPKAHAWAEVLNEVVNTSPTASVMKYQNLGIVIREVKF